MAERIQVLSVQLVPFIMAVVFHEFAHGFIAHRWGDNTARDAGRLTLNPVPHMDLFGTLIFPAIGMLSGMSILLGWAKPVPINPSRFKKYRPGLFWVSIAGPGMNFLLALVSALVFSAVQLWVPQGFYLKEPLVAMSIVSVSTNYALGIFNLLPLPPLDGSKIIESALSYNAMRKYQSLEQYATWIFLGLLLTGALTFLSYPIRFLTDLTLYGSAVLFHLPEVFTK